MTSSKNIYLDYEGAAKHLNKILPTGKRPVTKRAVRRYDQEKKLPFFMGPQGRKIIQLNELEHWVMRSQVDASNALLKR